MLDYLASLPDAVSIPLSVLILALTLAMLTWDDL